MRFVWDIKDNDWNEYRNLIKRCYENDSVINTAGVVGCCRVGDLVFDIRAWGEDIEHCALGYELFVGGIDSGYSETENGYPYDIVDEYGEFPINVINMKLDDFKKIAEPVFETFIKNTKYELTDLMSKANEPTNYNL